ncbi:MAG: sugar ABC transporter ATP-binding protein [Solobacterium sp.]|nr:sugar ABC transporter ATP-binding protein [Solobacterium sp.]
MKNIGVEFPGVRALKGVDLTIESQKVTALIGANGAGKSTLMKVLSGVYNHYTGQITIDGKDVEIREPNTAKLLGIETVYQEVDTALEPNLSVAENIMVDYLVNGLGKKQFFNWNYIYKTSQDILDKLGLDDIDNRQLVGTMPLAKKQMVVIARAVLRDCRFLVLDEPTAALSEAETQHLFEIVRDLKNNRGVGVIFISHRLNELFEICDTLTVLRDGNLVLADQPLTKETTINDIVQYMLGETYDQVLDRSGRTIGEKVLEVEGLTEFTGKCKDCSFYVRSGEIVGIAGLVGAGKTEMLKTLYAALPVSSGVVKVHGKEISPRIPADAVKAGICMIPEERRKEGLELTMSVAYNLSMATLSKYAQNPMQFLDKKQERVDAVSKVEQLHIATPSIDQQVMFLSGGNQQKVVIGKWIGSDADVFIFDEPTQGIDVGAKQEVYKLCIDLARQGKAVIYCTSETGEILALTDRTYVMYDGQIQKEFNTAETNEQQILVYSTGGTN